MRKKQIKVNGKSFTVNLDKPEAKTFWDRVVKGKWEPHTFDILKRFLNRKHSYIDVGAWIGPTVLYGSQFAGHCYALEPDPVAFSSLRTNLALSPHAEKFTSIFEGCLTNRGSRAKLGLYKNVGDSSSSFIWSNSSMSWSVPAWTIEKFVKEHNIDNLNFIKMDIEGGEVSVLPAMRKFLERNKPTILLSLHYWWYRNAREDLRKVLDVLSSYKNTYTREGKPISIDTLSSGSGMGSPSGKYSDVVATDEDWSE